MDDNDYLNLGCDWGFVVFGMVMDGYEIFDKIMCIEIVYNEKIGYSFVLKIFIVILNVKVFDVN